VPDPYLQTFRMDAVTALLALRIALTLECFVTDRAAVIVTYLRKVIFLMLLLLTCFDWLPQKLMSGLRFALAGVFVLNKPF